jgi:hypothetical protein
MGRDGELQLYLLVNELRRFAYPGPGLTWAIADEAIAAFKCVARSATTDNVVLARADGAVYATGVLSTAVLVGELAKVITQGIITGAVSGRAANDAVWVGPDGSLVFAAPGGANYDQPIAVCVNATDIYVNPEVPVI